MKNLFELIGDCEDNIQDLVLENCIIPAGTKLEIYCNRDGVHSDSDGFSLLILFDVDTFYYELVEDYYLLGYCYIEDGQVSISLSDEEDIIYSVWSEMCS